ncbi:DUF1593 domain-containing protein [Porifericola rhodea]|uniref:DUF1593 domain-containing protein n=1 Tax=Porifericola rhodea TaxID=930972 RepID=UPI002666DBDE|nr:nucleoside hydrolase-like domain-containing protein [Porifericola rhodea]WKN31501.1 DUF1593 domain-containing protein [Porifericola rhodea]
MKNLLLLFTFSLNFIICSAPSQTVNDNLKVIVTTDGEFDDRCSMVRFLLYANEFDVKGIVHTSSKFHWKGRGSVAGHQWHDVSWIEEHLEAYENVYDKLIVHSSTYPSPTYLRSIVAEGNIDLAGDMEHETEGSQLIVKVLLENDDKPVYLQAWGGANTIARALKTIDEKYPNRKKEVSQKARLYLIMQQDSTFEQYIKPNWPELTTLISTAFPAIGYPWKKSIPDSLQHYYSSEWMNEYLFKGNGPLLEIYKNHLYGARQTGAFISEGDSPAFMYSIPNGLNSKLDPSWGSWGGRFKEKNSTWQSAEDEEGLYQSIYRWIPAFQHDFAARAKWCVSSNYHEANHPPQVRINCKEQLKAKPGEYIQIDASSSTDPDGDTLNFNWWQYHEAGTYQKPIALDGAKTSSIRFKISETAKPGQSLHIICEVSDNAYPSMTRYKRVVILIK